MNIYYDKDCDLSIIKGMNVTIVGYGSQGHAHANNLKDSGVNVTVALRPDSASVAKAEASGLTVKSVEDAVKDADLVMILTPDEFQSQLYRSQIAPNGTFGTFVRFFFAIFKMLIIMHLYFINIDLSFGFSKSCSILVQCVKITIRPFGRNRIVSRVQVWHRCGSLVAARVIWYYQPSLITDLFVRRRQLSSSMQAEWPCREEM